MVDQEGRMKEEKKGIIAINVDLNCTLICESCEKFFKCKNPEKLKIFDRRRMAKAKETMAKIKYKIAICAGKGGVGKSTVTVNMAAALAMKGRKVAILDQDLDGPCIPRMLGLLGKKLNMGRKGIIPVEGLLGIKVISMSLIRGEDDTTTWFHELRRNATEEFIAHVDYGELDYLLVDLPPGTSSDAVNIMEYIPDLDGTVVVTNPTWVSQIVARRATLMALEGGVNVLGVVENMSGFVCPGCSEVHYLMKKGGGERVAEELEVPFLGRIPLDPVISKLSDGGTPYVYEFPESEPAKAMFNIVNQIVNQVEELVGLWKDKDNIACV